MYFHLICSFLHKIKFKSTDARISLEIYDFQRVWKFSKVYSVASNVNSERGINALDFGPSARSNYTLFYNNCLCVCLYVSCSFKPFPKLIYPCFHLVVFLFSEWDYLSCCVFSFFEYQFHNIYVVGDTTVMNCISGHEKIYSFLATGF